MMRKECGAVISGFGHCTLPLHDGHSTHKVPVWGQFATLPNWGDIVMYNTYELEWKD